MSKAKASQAVLMDQIVDGGEVKRARLERKAGEEISIDHPGEGTIIAKIVRKKDLKTGNEMR